jgi:hypothetical protein
MHALVAHHDQVGADLGGCFEDRLSRRGGRAVLAHREALAAEALQRPVERDVGLEVRGAVGGAAPPTTGEGLGL